MTHKMIKQIGIEYVCTGNGGRSPIAEIIGKDYTMECGLEEQVKVYSSGTAADISENDLFQIPVGFMLDYVEIGLNSGTYHGKAEALAAEIMADKDGVALAVANGDKEIMDKVEFSIRYLMADEVSKRTRVLLEDGLVPIGHFHQQTMVRDDVDLILPMKQSNADSVKKIYAGSRYNPTIMPICEYAGISRDIADPFAGTIEDFRKTRDLIGNAVKKTIDRAVDEYNLK